MEDDRILQDFIRRATLTHDLGRGQDQQQQQHQNQGQSQSRDQGPSSFPYPSGSGPGSAALTTVYDQPADTSNEPARNLYPHPPSNPTQRDRRRTSDRSRPDHLREYQTGAMDLPVVGHRSHSSRASRSGQGQEGRNYRSSVYGASQGQHGGSSRYPDGGEQDYRGEGDRGTPRSGEDRGEGDGDSGTESFEDQGTYDPTPLTPAPDHRSYAPESSGVRSVPTRQSQLTAATATMMMGKRRGRPALPPEERDERRRERARQSAAEARRKKRDVEGEREWWKEVEIEKAVLEEKYRTLVRDHSTLKSQVASIPCLSLLNPHLALLVNAPSYPITGSNGPMLQLVLPLLLQTIARGENGIDVDALIGLIQEQGQARRADSSRTMQRERAYEPPHNDHVDRSSRNTRKRKSSERTSWSEREMAMPIIEGEGDGSTSTDSAQSTPRVARRRVKRVRMELTGQGEYDGRDRLSAPGRDPPDNTAGIDDPDPFGTGIDDHDGLPETPGGNIAATPSRSPVEPRTSILMSLRKRTQPSTLPEPIPATPIDSDEDDGDFIPESELDENGPTPRTEQGPGSSPGTYDETPRTGVEGEEEDEDDERFDYDPDDPDFSQPIVDVAVPAWFGTTWAGAGGAGESSESSEAIREQAIGNEERDELVARLRAEMDKTPRED